MTDQASVMDCDTAAIPDRAWFREPRERRAAEGFGD
jgi:hypothetical protein